MSVRIYVHRAHAQTLCMYIHNVYVYARVYVCAYMYICMYVYDTDRDATYTQRALSLCSV